MRADQNYIRHIGTSMLSVLANNRFPIHFHLLVSGSENYDFNIFNQLKNINPNYAVTVYHLNTDYFSTLQTTSYFTIAMYYRMCIPAILGDISDTALYLDTDVLCLGDISELFTVNLDRKLLAAVPETTLYRAYINKLNVFGFRSTGPLLQFRRAAVQQQILERIIRLHCPKRKNTAGRTQQIYLGMSGSRSAQSKLQRQSRVVAGILQLDTLASSRK